MNTTQTGRNGEERAARWLEQNNCRVLARNFSAPGGEIDIIAMDGTTLAFVEVKTRAYEAFGGPAAAVTPAKQKRLAQTAQRFLQANRLKFDSIRFDVICVLPDRMEHIPNAFTPARTTL